MQEKNIIKFFYELGQLWRVKHAGWFVAGVRNPESIAEHVFRTAQIGFVLAHLEGLNAERVALMCLIHDNGEARVGDVHRVANRYMETKESERKAAEEQFERLPEKIANSFKSLYQEFEERKTKEARCAKDADYLEQAVTAKEYIEKGYKGCQDWINNIKRALKTESAKKLVKVIEETDSNKWWQGLKKLPDR